MRSRDSKKNSSHPEQCQSVALYLHRIVDFQTRVCIGTYNRVFHCSTLHKRVLYNGDSNNSVNNNNIYVHIISYKTYLLNADSERLKWHKRHNFMVSSLFAPILLRLLLLFHISHSRRRVHAKEFVT
jgi:hypothetical protein